MTETTQMARNDVLRKVITRRLHYPLEVMLVCARWYAAYPLSFRHIKEMMRERGVFVDHAIAHRWALKILSVLALVFRRRKRPAGASCRMDETYIKVAGQWKYLCRAVDKAAVRRYLMHAVSLHGLPEKIIMDKNGANTAAIHSTNADARLKVDLHQSKYLNNIMEQDHRAVKRVTGPMPRFKSFWSARKLLAGIETMHTIKKGQLDCPDGKVMSTADQFYSLAF